MTSGSSVSSNRNSMGRVGIIDPAGTVDRRIGQTAQEYGSRWDNNGVAFIIERANDESREK
jgi:hypothetical protein